MAAFSNVLICSGLALLVFTCIGLPLALRMAPSAAAAMLAPGLGWALHSAVALPIFFLVRMSQPAAIVVLLAPMVAALAVLSTTVPGFAKVRLGPLALVALIGAAGLSLAVMAGVLPKVSMDSVTLAAPIFDHSKVAMINEMTRSGVPPDNPFIGATGLPHRLSYYYLWHFTAAELSLAAGASGWEADAGLTWFSAFASLALMIGLAIWLSGRASAGLWVIALAATASLRPLLNRLAGVETIEAVAGYQSGFGGWLFQTSWAPQHMTSAMAAVLAVLLLTELARRPGPALSVVVGMTMATCFESSTWIGGIVLPVAASVVALVLLLRAEPAQRLRIVLYMAGTALVALLLISPMLYDQLQMASLRGVGSPIAITPYDVYTDRPDGALGDVANMLAYWTVLLVVEFPAFYLAGIAGVAISLVAGNRVPERNTIILSFALLLATSLVVAWLLVSTLGDNNDVSWRGVLPGVLLLIVFSAVALTRWLARPVSFAAYLAIALLLLGLPDGALIMYGNVVGEADSSAKVFAATPALWQAMRRHASPGERVANNPLFLEHMTPWPVNISWALLSNRRSCYAGATLVGPFSALPAPRNEAVDALFIRVFAGHANAEDIAQLATTYNCGVAVVTPQDAAWNRDPFAASHYYRLVEHNRAWRIYKLTTLASAARR
jgi:hypothetical protein